MARARSRLVRLSAAGAVVSLVSAVLLVAAPWPPRAAADLAPTASATTKSGKAGRFDDFSLLRVSVSKTTGLTNEAILVTWEGGKQTPLGNGFSNSSLMIVQCWGAEDDPRLRETCQYGSFVDHPFGTSNPVRNDTNAIGMGERYLLAGDPREDALPAASQLPDDAMEVPFVAVYGDRTHHGGVADPYERTLGGSPIAGYEQVREFFRPETTNEAPYLSTAADGKGRHVFEVMTDFEAPHLGCGKVVDIEGQSRPRACTLVVVPRGEHDPITGALLDPSVDVVGSPLAAAHWENRIVFALEFEPTGDTCDLEREQRLVVGSELIEEAALSWTSRLCQQGGANFSYSALGDFNANQQLTRNDDRSPGMAITSEPIAARAGGPPVVHAPVALMGMAVGFMIDVKIDPGGVSPLAPIEAQAIADIKLNQRLVAKLLTQSYSRGAFAGSLVRPENPRTIRNDPEFLALNELFNGYQRLNTNFDGIIVTGNATVAARQVWRWILADPAARQWLAGTPDEHGMTINPAFLTAPMASNEPVETFPKLDPACVVPFPEIPQSRMCMDDIAPYVGRFNTAAQRTLRDDSRSVAAWNPFKQPQPGFDLRPPDPIGARWGMSITDTASAERYGIFTASLRNANGDYVKPSPQSLGAAAAGALAPTSVTGVSQIDPSKPVKDAYPLALLGYAAVDVSEAQTARQEYAAFIRHAVQAGQVPGELTGQLPPGYAPIPPALRDQALQVAEIILNPPPSASQSSSTSPASSSSSNTTNATNPTRPGGARPSTAAPTPTPTPTPTPSASPEPPRNAVSLLTPSDPVGWLQFLLIVLLGLGVAATIAGPVMMAVGRRWPNGPASP